MQGAIGVESTPGEGSTFWIELPEGTAPEIRAKEKPVQKSNDQSADDPDTLIKLLYIEDSPAHIKLMERLVKDIDGLSLLTANTPNLGLELAFAHKPDLILCDICLPGMSGYQLLKHFQSDPETSHIPVIAISASAMPQEIEKGLLAGFRRYFTKPIKVAELKQSLKELLLDEASLHKN